MSEWISVEDAAVPQDKTVLIANKLGEVCPFMRGVIQNNPGYNDWGGRERISHWMPLPEPPTND